VTRARVLLLLLLAGCFSHRYEPGALTDAANGRRHTNARRVSECIDLATWAISSSEVEPRVLLRIDFANRCDRSFVVDLSKLRVEGAFAEGARSALEPYDPQRTIGPGRLAPHGEASENIAYGTGHPSVLPSAICVDVSGIIPHGARDLPEKEPICFGPGDDGFIAREPAVQ
jgi:hypothetical protein